MIKKISCGGFSVDNETIIEENGVLKAIGGGSSGILVINGTPGEEDPQHPGQYALTLDKTFEEISAAMPSCILRIEEGEGVYVVLNPFSDMDSGIYFGTVFEQKDGAEIFLAEITSNNVANFTLFGRDNLPTVTSADAGKFLGVGIGGSWAPLNLPGEEYDVRFTKSGSSWTMNHDYDELKTAARMHKKMTFHIQGKTGCGILEYYDDGTTVEFYGTSVGYGDGQFTAYNILVTGTVKTVNEQVIGNAFNEPQGS